MPDLGRTEASIIVDTKPTCQANLVLVVDDDVFFREGVGGFLRRRGYVTLEAADSQTALALAERHRPAAVIIDIVLPSAPRAADSKEDNEGVELTRLLKRMAPTMAVVLVSELGDRSDAVLQLVTEGVRGLAYLAKGYRTGPAALLQALEETRASHVIIRANEPSSGTVLAKRFWARLTPEERHYVRRAVALLPHLTVRERQTAYAIAHAQTISSIATALNIAPPTVEKHVNHIYGKLELDEAALQQPPLRKSLLLAKACWLLELLGDDNGDRL